MNLLYLIRVVVVTILYYVVGSLSFLMAENSDSIITIVLFGAEGIGLASVLLYGRKMWISIFIGQFFLAYHAMPLFPSLGIATVNSVEALIAVTLFNYLNLNRKLVEIRDIFGLIFLIIFVLQPFSAVFGTSILALFSMISWSNYFSSGLTWWFSNVMGQLLFTPLILLMYANYKKEELPRFIVVAVFFAVMSYIFHVVVPITNPLLLLSVTLPFILYLSAIHGVHYGMFTTMIIAFVSLYLTHENQGLFVIASEIDNIINLNSYFLFQILLQLIVGTLFAEKRNREKILEEKVKEEVEKNKKQQLHMFQRNRLTQMGEMLSMIAHQWRQPLNNLSLIHQMLILKYEEGGLSKDDINEFEKDSESQVKGMSQTISDFSDFFRPEMKEQEFRIEDVIVKSIEFLRPVLRKENIIVELTCSQQEIKLFGYPNELGQTIINLINNAKDALIEKEVKKKNIMLTITIEEHFLTLSIADNAGGIPDDIMTNIFDPYFSTKDKNGTGLGLYMSKMIVEEHMRGSLSVENSNKGAVFTIKLPVIESKK